MNRRRAIVTGATGQDGSYMAELLVAKDYDVLALTRREPAAADRALRYRVWDPADHDALRALLAEEQPDEFYNFAAHSTGAGMFDDPVAIGGLNGLLIAAILEAIRLESPATRFCQASSAEMFGRLSGTPQRETSRFDPRSPYGAAKLYAHAMIGLYRERFGVFGCSAILFNHESPRRGEAFVTRRITRGVAAIRRGLQHELTLGALDTRRDWGFAGDYVRAMWLMLQRDIADDYVIATGRTHSVEDFCRIAFAHAGLDYRDHVRLDPAFVRAPEPLQLVGDPHKAARELGWSADMRFEQLVAMMVDADLARTAPRKV